jgi:hypothetical protein
VGLATDEAQTRGRGHRRLTPRTLALALSLAACATPQVRTSHVLVVTDADGAAVWSGAATFVVRDVVASSPVRVVGLPGLGEVQVGVAGEAEACRLVWAKDGLDRLVLFTAAHCAARATSGRLCFAAARLKRTGSVDDGTPRSLVVDGCADENKLLWSKLDGAAPATLGPSAYRERCVHLPRDGVCQLSYVKKRAVSPADGFTFRFDGDEWRACFLEKRAGPYAIDLYVEDSCGRAVPLSLVGSSADLD